MELNFPDAAEAKQPTSCHFLPNSLLGLRKIMEILDQQQGQKDSANAIMAVWE